MYHSVTFQLLRSLLRSYNHKLLTFVVMRDITDVYVYCAKSAKTDTAIRRIEDTPEESFTAHNTEHSILPHEFESMVH